ncbi:hypothetical protein DKX38_028876 [Salix brachista]|uniref:Uncharacterized protein n=1 Tax=Salix brachista TaxID=2182728 RepID=A0A5N5IXP3_9ROSI|nr:hypothetical protein DKX38_028876 [Salix brachista]
MKIPLEEEINKEEEASNDSKEEDLGIQASEEEFGHYSTECRKKAPVELHEQANYADEDAIIIKDSNGRLIAFVKMSKNRMFPLNIQYDAAKCLTAITNNLILEDEAEVPTVLVEDPRVPEEEPQSPVHSFPVFNRRNSPTPGTSSTSPEASSLEEPRMRNLEDLYNATQQSGGLECEVEGTEGLGRRVYVWRKGGGWGVEDGD